MAAQTGLRPTLEPNPFLGCRLGLLDSRTHEASLSIRGALCAVTAEEHGRQLRDLVDQGYLRLRIDLGELSLCTSDGLDLWDDVQHRLDPLDGRLTLSGATGVVRRVLDIATRDDSHFCPWVEPAVAA